MEPRLAAVRSFMSSLGTGGKPRLLIRDNCRFLIQALAADYIYENRSGGRTADTPTKSHVGWVSDLSDSLQYLSMGVLLVMSTGDDDVAQYETEIEWC